MAVAVGQRVSVVTSRSAPATAAVAITMRVVGVEEPDDDARVEVDQAHSSRRSYKKFAETVASTLGYY